MILSGTYDTFSHSVSNSLRVRLLGDRQVAELAVPDTAKAAFLKSTWSEGAGPTFATAARGHSISTQHRNVVSPCEISTYS